MSLEHNRESWLTELAKQIVPLFKGFKIDPWRITCGWPSVNGMGTKTRRVGECHGPKSSKGKIFELFISPTLEKPGEVAGTVAHELAHVAAGIDAAHGKFFKRVCHQVGLTKGKPTQAMPGERLASILAGFAEKLGAYPHSAIVPDLKTSNPSSTLSLECECGCRVSMGRKWADEVGYPVCACGKPFVIRNKE